jgi:hypothetical protein
VWPDEDRLPEDFEHEYCDDLSSLRDDDDPFESEFTY